MAKMGAPTKEIDFNLFEQLCSIQCTQSEIASMLKVHVDTLRDKVQDKYGDTFSTVYKKYSEDGKCSLRRNQFLLSKTNTAMAIWLGKQWLGQREPEIEHKEEKQVVFQLTYDPNYPVPIPSKTISVTDSNSAA